MLLHGRPRVVQIFMRADVLKLQVLLKRAMSGGDETRSVSVYVYARTAGCSWAAEGDVTRKKYIKVDIQYLKYLKYLKYL